jgi:hypothetical protein
MTAADEIRRDMIEAGDPEKDLAVLPFPCTCGTVFGTRPELEDHREETGHEPARRVWTSRLLQEDFEVLGFAAPFVVVRRRSDGVKGSLEFTHHPRVYFNWQEAS